MGIQLAGEDEIAGLNAEVRRIAMGDLNLAAIGVALAAFGIDAATTTASRWRSSITATHRRISVIGCFASTTWPSASRPGADCWRWASAREYVRLEMTRLCAVADAAPADVPTLLMDTAPAAILGALGDPRVAEQDDLLVANVGNFHCLAFHLSGGAIARLFRASYRRTSAGAA